MGASRNPIARLEHIREEIRDLTVATTGTSLADFLGSYVLRRTAEHAVLIISEAARALPSELTDRYPGVAWVQIKGVGNVLRHDYYAIDPRILWNILSEHLPASASVVDEMLGDLGA